MPTRFTVGAYDEADAAVVRRQAATVPGVRFTVLLEAAHMTPWDALAESVQLAYRDAIRSATA